MREKIRDFVRSLVGYYVMVDNYEERLAFQSKYYEDSIHEILDKYVDEKQRRDDMEEELRVLLEDKKLDILSLKDYYEAKFASSRTWAYNYDSKYSKPVENSLLNADEGIMKEAAKQLINDTNVSMSKKLTKKSTPEEVISKVVYYFMRPSNWTYVSDIKEYGVREFWAPAHISWQTRRGDCDSLAILMHNLIFYIFEELGLSEHYWRLKLTAWSTMVEPHAFNIWLGEDGEWYVIESTLDLIGSFTKTWLKTPIRFNNLYSSPWGFARRDRSWVGRMNSLLPYEGQK